LIPASPVVPQTTLIPAKTRGWDGFAGSLPDNQRLVLTALNGAGKLSLEDIRSILDLPGNQEVSVVLTGIIKNAKKRSIPQEDVFVRDRVGKSVFYSPGPGLRGAGGFGPPAKENTP
jgi:hypothetical protein